jgi:predicted dehydrogenase
MKTLRGALVGFGFIAERGHAPAYAAKASPLEIVAVAEPCEARHPAIRAALPRARIYVDHQTLLLRESLDFVDVCTPPNEHMNIALAAFARGLHVLCEKPLAMTPLEARRMADAATRSQRVLFPAHSYRHAPVIRAVRGLLSRDLIGPVRMATIDTYRTGHARGAAEWYPDWRRDPHYSGGGILMDHGPHTSYLAFEWLGGHPSRVSAWTRSVREDAVEDDATCTLVFPAGIVRAHLSWNAGFRRVIYTLHGDRGAIRVEDDEVELVIRGANGEVRTERSSQPSNWRDAGHGPWFEGVLREFHQAIERRDLVGRDTQDAVMGTHVISAAQSSAGRGGIWVSLPSLQDAPPMEKVA